MRGQDRWERLRYRFDNAMSRGTSAMIGLLGLASAALVALGTLLALALVEDQEWWDAGGWVWLLWQALLHAIDPGTIAGDKDPSPYAMILMLVITLGGIFIVSALIGVLNTGLAARLAKLRKGRSKVIETGHTVLLGWSEQVFTVAEELVRANASESASCVAVLGDADKVEMEDALRERLGNTGKTRFVCRSGDPTDPADLEIASLDTAKSIIVLPPDDGDADIHVIKTLLSLSRRTWAGARPTIVAGIDGPHNLEAAQVAGGPEALVVRSCDVVAGLIVQSCRHSGVSTITTNLLGFAGEEFYIRAEPSLAGMSYRDALYAFETATLTGICHEDGVVDLNPPGDMEITDTDELIVIAEDDSTIRLARTPYKIYEETVEVREHGAPDPERVLLLGWNSRAERVVADLDDYAAPGSHLLVAAPETRQVRGLDALRHLDVEVTECDVVDRPTLESLEPGTFDDIIVLPGDEFPQQHADSRTLVTLIHLRNIAARRGESYSIVSEIHDERNRRLAEVTRADDFVVSGRLISLMLTQLAENRRLANVFGQLFSPEGMEIYLRPAGEYVRTDRETNFATVIEAAMRRGQTAIGYRITKQKAEPDGFGIFLNPDKSAPLTLSGEDSVIVLALH